MDSAGHPSSTSHLAPQANHPPLLQRQQGAEANASEARRGSGGTTASGEVDAGEASEVGYEPSESSSGGEAAGGGGVLTRSVTMGAAGGGGSGEVQRSTVLTRSVSADQSPRPSSHPQQASFQPPTYPPPATPLTASRLPTKTNRSRVTRAAPLPTPPSSPGSPTTTTTSTPRTASTQATTAIGPVPRSPLALRTPSDTTAAGTSSASEAERELAVAQREGRVVYETSPGHPLPLGNIAEAGGSAATATKGATSAAKVGGSKDAQKRMVVVSGSAAKQSAEEEKAAKDAQEAKDRREGLKTDLDRFVAPSAPAKGTVAGATTVLPAHLPNLAYLPSTAPTSLPIPRSAVQHDLDASLGRLLSEEVFWEMLRDPLGRHRFRAYLMGLGKEEVLDLWWDAELCEQIAKMVRGGASAIQSVYFDSTEGALERLCPGAESQLVHAQRTDSSFSALSRAVLRGMYDAHFKQFVKRKLVEQSQVRLGSIGAERQGVGEVFCVTNPRLRDNPIVLVSEAFCAMFGYKAEAILGRNCRFLQGPGTSPGSVQRIRQALISGEEHTELLLNYTSLGLPIWNLLCLVPLRARDGSVAYFIGGQIDVTGSIQSTRRLSFLIGGASSTYSAEGIPKLNTFEFSPTLVSHRPKLAQDLRDFQGTGANDPERDVGTTQGRDQPQKHIGGLSTHARQELGGLPYDQQMAGGASKPVQKVLDRLKHLVGAGEKADDQLLLPAEKSWQSAGPLQPQIDMFSNTYQRLLVIRPKGQEILYVTRALIAFLGLPITSSQDLFSSSLLHTDLLSLLDLGPREATRRARDKIRHAIRSSQAISIVVGLRVLPQSLFSLGVGKKAREGASEGLRRVALHLTPLTDRDGVTGAFIVIVS